MKIVFILAAFILGVISGGYTVDVLVPKDIQIAYKQGKEYGKSFYEQKLSQIKEKVFQDGRNAGLKDCVKNVVNFSEEHAMYLAYAEERQMEAARIFNSRCEDK